MAVALMLSDKSKVGVTKIARNTFYRQHALLTCAELRRNSKLIYMPNDRVFSTNTVYNNEIKLIDPP